MIGMVLSLAVTAVLLYVTATSLLGGISSPASQVNNPVSSAFYQTASTTVLAVVQSASSTAALAGRLPAINDLMVAAATAGAQGSVQVTGNPGFNPASPEMTKFTTNVDGTNVDVCVLLPTTAGSAGILATCPL